MVISTYFLQCEIIQKLTKIMQKIILGNLYFYNSSYNPLGLNLLHLMQIEYG